MQNSPAVEGARLRILNSYHALELSGQKKKAWCSQYGGSKITHLGICSVGTDHARIVKHEHQSKTYLHTYPIHVEMSATWSGKVGHLGCTSIGTHTVVQVCIHLAAGPRERVREPRERIRCNTPGSGTGRPALHVRATSHPCSCRPSPLQVTMYICTYRRDTPARTRYSLPRVGFHSGQESDGTG